MYFWRKNSDVTSVWLCHLKVRFISDRTADAAARCYSRLFSRWGFECFVFRRTFSRCGSRTGGRSGESARSVGVAAASWRSTVCTARWCVTPSRCQSPSSTPPRTAWWDPAPPGCSVSRIHVSATHTHHTTHQYTGYIHTEHTPHHHVDKSTHSVRLGHVRGVTAWNSKRKAPCDRDGPYTPRLI